VLNQWHHLALTRSGNTFRIFINGVLEDSSTRYTGSVGADTYPTYIGGGANQTNRMLSGMVSNARIITGTAVYTSAFTPPTAPLTKTDDTVMLMNFTDAGVFDGTGRNVLETVGDARIVNDVKKYGTGAMYFDGTGDYLSIPYNDFYEIGSGDYTVECWIYQQTAGEIVGAFNVTFPFPGFLFSTDFNPSNGKLAYFGSDGTNTENFQGTNAVPNNTWTHIAMSKQGSTLRFFINGTLDSTHSLTIEPAGSNQNILIGADSNSPPARLFQGYIDDLRITKGVARYTANFTPPAAKLPNL